MASPERPLTFLFNSTALTKQRFAKSRCTGVDESKKSGANSKKRGANHVRRDANYEKRDANSGRWDAKTGKRDANSGRWDAKTKKRDANYGKRDANSRKRDANYGRWDANCGRRRTDLGYTKTVNCVIMTGKRFILNYLKIYCILLKKFMYYVIKWKRLDADKPRRSI